MSPASLHFFDEDRGVALATKSGHGAILATADGGHTWSKMVDLGPGVWTEVFVLDDQHGWAAGTTDRDVAVRSFAPK